MEDLSPDEWRAKFTVYYQTNAPTKVSMVNDSMMEKWAGKYDSLYGNLVKKYGPLGKPLDQPVAAAPKPGGKKTEEDYASWFQKEISKEQTAAEATKGDAAAAGAASMFETKAKNAYNGLETSTFTVCARIRPELSMDSEPDNYPVIIPGQVGLATVGEDGKAAADGDYREEAMVMSPKMTITGRPKLEKQAYDFDFTFGPDHSADHIFAQVGEPLVQKVLQGQVGVVFAYGQTGSGKTHTMNGIMSSLSRRLFGASEGEGTGRKVTFSYLEIKGQSATDCLDPAAPEGNVKIGEMLNGELKILNITTVDCKTPEEFDSTMAIASSHRATAATEKNDTSSRSHGCGIITVHSAVPLGADMLADESLPRPAPGVLYVIDLAGSERLADSKNHSDERMEETKAINLSLMALKECIRARTMAGCGDGRSEVHVPYRRSKLTLLMKDAFDIACSRLCSTVVIGHVSPMKRDVKHSQNTLAYAAPLRVAVRAAPNKSYERDPNDPALWNAEQASAWVRSKEAAIDPSWLLPPGSGGLDLCRLPEPAFYSRVVAASPGDKVEAAAAAKRLYAALWMQICDAKVRRRRPDGTIITIEQEEAERQAEDEARKEKARIWAEREKHLRTEH